MRIFAGLVVLTFMFSASAYGQNWQSVFTMDSRIGYTTNTYLNPFVSDWDPNVESAYGFLAPVGQFSMASNRFSADGTGSLFFEPVFDGRTPWRGGLGLINPRYRISGKWSAGLEAGANYTTGASEQSLFWLVPALTYSPSLFTQIRMKAGSSYRKFNSETEPENGYSRFDSYAFELETWPNFKWKLKGGVYGSLANPSDNLSGAISVDYLVTPSLRFSLRTGLNQFQYQVITETGGGGGGQPPIGGPPQTGEEISDEADRIFRAGVSGTYQINNAFSLTLNADYLNYFSTAAQEIPSGMQASAGIRYSFSPNRLRNGSARAEWKQNGKQTVMLQFNDVENGQLYITGDFNDWKRPGIPLVRQKRNRYAVQLSLNPGAHEYKVLLIKNSGEEQWIELSEDTYTVSDGFGGENGIIFIE